MTNTQTTGYKFLSLILITLMLIFSIIFFASCNNNKGKTAFSPESELYTFYFDENWRKFDIESPFQLLMSDTELSNMVIIDCYFKSNLSEQGISDLDAYIDVYTQSDIQGIYEGNQADVLESFKADSPILNGKRQKVYIKAHEYNPDDSISEIIHFETKDFYFTIAYSNITSKFEAAQKKIDEALKTLKINYKK